MLPTNDLHLTDEEHAAVDAAFQQWFSTYEPPRPPYRGFTPGEAERIGKALIAIRDGRLYREKYATFWEYCAGKWGMTPERASQYMWQAENEQPVHEVVSPAKPNTEPRESWVYFIRCGDSVKIGVAVDVRKRLSSLQTGNPAPLSLMASMPGDEKAERKLHKQFSADRLSGEWFDLSPALREYIGGL